MEQEAVSKGNPPASWLYLAWLGTFLSTIVIGALGAAVQGDPARLVMKWGFSDFALFAIILYVAGSAIAVLVLGRLLKAAGLGFRDIGWRGRLSGSSAVAAIAAAAAACGLYWLADISLPPVGIPMRWHAGLNSHLVLNSRTDVLLAVAFAVLIGPVVEEIIFRGYVLTALRARLRSPAIALLLASLIFASVHVWIGPGAMVFILVWAVLPSWLYLRYHSLFPAILFHALNNSVAYLAVPLWFG